MIKLTETTKLLLALSINLMALYAMAMEKMLLPIFYRNFLTILGIILNMKSKLCDGTTILFLMSMSRNMPILLRALMHWFMSLRHHQIQYRQTLLNS